MRDRGVSLRTKMTGGILALLLLMSAALGGLSYLAQTERIEDEMRRVAEIDLALFDAVWQDEANRALTLADSIVALPEVRKAFASGDREALYALVEPLWMRAKDRYGIGQMQFHQPDAVSFLRMNNKKFGDSLAFRTGLVAVNRERKAFIGPELGPSGFFLRGIVPVEAEGKHIGSFEVGIDLKPIACGGGDHIRQQREQWTDGANAFCLAPGVIFSYSRNVGTAEALAKEGYHVLPVRQRLADPTVNLLDGRKYLIQLECGELSRARGGPRCMTFPLARA